LTRCTCDAGTPQCSAVEGKLDWREALLGAGMGVDAMECFDTQVRERDVRYMQ
jgi:hypothetical protein